jgi:hypothetical protein
LRAPKLAASSMYTDPGSRMKPVRTTRRPFTDGDASLAA